MIVRLSVSHNTARAGIDIHFRDGLVSKLMIFDEIGENLLSSVAEAFRSHELCLAIDRSFAEGGRMVKLPLDD